MPRQKQSTGCVANALPFCGNGIAPARAFLAEKTVTGLIFHLSFIAALDVPAVKLAKEWIRSHGESVWGTRGVGARRFF
jgi:hypothetical protein